MTTTEPHFASCAGENAAPEFVTVSQACDMFSVSHPTVYKMIRSGVVKAVKIGRGTRVEMASIRQYFASLPKV